MAAVRLEGALRHLDQTPARSICGLQQSSSIPQKPPPTHPVSEIGQDFCPGHNGHISLETMWPLGAAENPAPRPSDWQRALAAATAQRSQGALRPGVWLGTQDSPLSPRSLAHASSKRNNYSPYPDRKFPKRHRHRSRKHPLTLCFNASTCRQTIARHAKRFDLRIDLHKEWCNEIFVPISLEFDSVIRATIKPAYQRRFSIHRIFALWLTLSFLFAMGSTGTIAKVSSNWS